MDAGRAKGFKPGHNCMRINSTTVLPTTCTLAHTPPCRLAALLHGRTVRPSRATLLLPMGSSFLVLVMCWRLAPNSVLQGCRARVGGCGLTQLWFVGDSVMRPLAVATVATLPGSDFTAVVHHQASNESKCPITWCAHVPFASVEGTASLTISG